MLYLVGILFRHGFDGHSNEVGSDAFSALVFACGEHGDVAAHRTASVGFEFADDYANEIILFIQSLAKNTSLSRRSSSR